MKTKFIIHFFAIIILFANSTHASTNTKDEDPEKDRVIVYVLKNILSRYHYVQKKLDDSFSEHVYNSFIEGLRSK
ncbi:hypothetical protein [Tenacibaculum sp. nBUS_03]|uniref:hypothetical protein n=1 Tax=Tenacibaculum sp. nBUS_03 TaxID=3395320 RepID=UPI003EB8A243